MKLHVKYFLYIGSLHVAIFLLCILYLREQAFIFLAAEIALLLSLYLAWRLYRGFVVPVRLLAAGAESLQDQDFSVQFNPVGQKELDALIIVYNRMISQLRKERARSAERHFFLEKLIEASPGGILLFDLEEKIFSINQAASRMLSSNPANYAGQTVEQLPVPFNSLLQQLTADKPEVIQLAGNRYYRCTLSHFVDQGFPRKFILMEELTEEIVLAEKRAYDKLIRVMAHEVNNSVAAVNALMQTIAEEEEADSEMHQALSIAINRNFRLGQFMNNFAHVVKLPQPVKKLVSLQKLILQLVPLAEADCKRAGVSCTHSLCKEDIQLEVDASQLEQVLLNALKNAREAAGEGGEVGISLTEHRLSITNSGPAISPEVQQQLFTPFYTTKPQGQGIGLMLIREILTNHRLNYQLGTRADGLTEFVISW